MQGTRIKWIISSICPSSACQNNTEYITYLYIVVLYIGTGLDWKSCPKGSYSNSTGLSKESECVPCDGGVYCDRLNSTKPTGECYGGYYCESGVDRPDPIHVGNATNHSNNCSIYGYHTGKWSTGRLEICFKRKRVMLIYNHSSLAYQGT